MQRINFILLGVLLTSILFLASCNDRENLLFDISKNELVYSLDVPMQGTEEGLVSPPNDVALDLNQFFSKFKKDGFDFIDPSVNLVEYDLVYTDRELLPSESFTLTFTVTDESDNLYTTFELKHDDVGRKDISFDFTDLNQDLTGDLSADIKITVSFTEVTLTSPIDFRFNLYADISVRGII